MQVNLELLKNKRHEQNLRLIDVAQHLGMNTANAYWRIEQGLSGISAVKMMRLCALFEIEPGNLWM